MRRIIKQALEAILPKEVLEFMLSAYHYLMAWAALIVYGFPARTLVVIGVTGTKGKSTTVEMVNAILEEAGYRTAIASTIRFKIDKESKPNLFKMTMPGYGYLQWFLREARRNDCTHVIVEITSEGARQFRHVGLMMDALIFTNIAPEHIESHGSYENYKLAKLAIGHSLVSSPKRPRIVIANPDDEVGAKFLTLNVDKQISFTLNDAKPYAESDGKVSMTVRGVTFEVPFPGTFTILNALAAATVATELGVSAKTIGHALGTMKPIGGRVERIEAGQNFIAVVDYAHTPDSLRALYGAFPNVRKICVLGNTGGGRDRWKRPEMGSIADTSCDVVILTDEDPYDEDPSAIVREMAKGMSRSPRIIIDRREAIRTALAEAERGDVVLITGKGTDPFIMGPRGTKMPWSDAAVVREELTRVRASNG